MSLYDADDTADILEFLCLMEVISFEDFEFALVFSQLKASVLGQAADHSWVLPAGRSGKHFFLAGTGIDGGHHGIAAHDIACIHPSAPLSSPARLSEAAHSFDKLAKRGLRTCLLYDAAEPKIGRDLLNMTDGERGVAWEIPAASARRTSGFLFSRNWKSGVCEQVVKVLDNYLPTLSPATRRGFSHHIEIGGNT